LAGEEVHDPELVELALDLLRLLFGEAEEDLEVERAQGEGRRVEPVAVVQFEECEVVVADEEFGVGLVGRERVARSHQDLIEQLQHLLLDLDAVRAHV
jgi:adenosyl cobinamide kinase/adenosyl cobinamide phosphate guanylyltransferase